METNKKNAFIKNVVMHVPKYSNFSSFLYCFFFKKVIVSYGDVIWFFVYSVATDTRITSFNFRQAVLNMIFYKKCYEKQYFYRFKIKYGCCELLAKSFIENVLKNILLFKVYHLLLWLSGICLRFVRLSLWFLLTSS